jgi:hypothetical protein
MLPIIRPKCRQRLDSIRAHLIQFTSAINFLLLDTVAIKILYEEYKLFYVPVASDLLFACFLLTSD